MRITIKPPSPAPSPPLPVGALLTVRVEAADPTALLAGPPSVAYEGRYADTPAPAFLFPSAGEEKRGVSTAAPAASDFRSPLLTASSPHVDIPAHEGDTITATLITPPPDGKAYTAAMKAGKDVTAPVELALAEGASAPPPSPQPADGLTITPVPAAALPPPLEEGDVVRLDTAPGADNLIVLTPAP